MRPLCSWTTGAFGRFLGGLSNTGRRLVTGVMVNARMKPESKYEHPSEDKGAANIDLTNSRSVFDLFKPSE
ncbi:MAG: hypothetical protein QXZ28_00845 [Candidatus Methanomethylicaceae archaeon]